MIRVLTLTPTQLMSKIFIWTKEVHRNRSQGATLVQEVQDTILLFSQRNSKLGRDIKVRTRSQTRFQGHLQLEPTLLDTHLSTRIEEDVGKTPNNKLVLLIHRRL